MTRGSVLGIALYSLEPWRHDEALHNTYLSPLRSRLRGGDLRPAASRNARRKELAGTPKIVRPKRPFVRTAMTRRWIAPVAGRCRAANHPCERLRKRSHLQRTRVCCQDGGWHKVIPLPVVALACGRRAAISCDDSYRTAAFILHNTCPKCSVEGFLATATTSSGHCALAKTRSSPSMAGLCPKTVKSGPNWAVWSPMGAFSSARKRPTSS